MHLAVNILSATSLIQAFGTIGILVILFAETGLLIGFFMPGDTLLFTAGVLTVPALANGYHLSLPVMLIGTPLAAILGAQVGHYIGAKAGPKLFSQEKSRFFRREYLARAEHHFHRYGEGRAVVIARFIPIIRTFVNPVAGALGMPARRFLVWNIIGGVLWTDTVVLVGHFLGAQLGKSFNLDKYMVPIVLVIALVSVIPVLIEVRKMRRASRSGDRSQDDDDDRRGSGSGASNGSRGASNGSRGNHRARNNASVE